MFICESGYGNLECNVGEKIHVDYAMYGRLTRRICSQYNTGHTNCRSGRSMTVVGSRCQGQRSCSLHATNGWFGDPCHGIFKYLEVRYRCITTGNALHPVLSDHTVLNCIFILLHCAALYCIVLHFVSFCWICILLCCVALHCDVLCFIVLHCVAYCCVALHLHFIVL